MIIEYQKLINLSDNTSKYNTDQPSKFRKKKLGLNK